MNSQTSCANFDVSFVVQQVQLKDLVRCWLKNNGFWTNVKQSCASFLRKLDNRVYKSFEPFLVSLVLHFSEIEDADLLYLVTKEPAQFENIVQELIFCFVERNLKESGDNHLKIAEEQIHCNIQVLGLPLIPSFTFTLKTVHINCALTTFRCIVFSNSGPVQQYVRQSVWKCQKCIGSPLIIHKNRKSNRNVYSCERCLKDCEEILSSRILSNFCKAQVFCAEDFKSNRLQSLSTNFTIELKIHDELCQELKLGGEYIVTGIFQPLQNSFDVWNFSAATV